MVVIAVGDISSLVSDFGFRRRAEEFGEDGIRRLECLLPGNLPAGEGGIKVNGKSTPVTPAGPAPRVTLGIIGPAAVGVGISTICVL